ncbi:MAG: hypothetical protein U1E21_01640 [Reyranellaceae bacterium]
MTASEGVVVPAGGGQHLVEASGQAMSMKLFGRETGASVTLFEQAMPAGGPGTCAFLPRNVPHAWKNSGTQPGRVVFLYIPAGAGRFVEEMLERPAEGGLEKRLEESGGVVFGPNPL